MIRRFPTAQNTGLHTAAGFFIAGARRDTQIPYPEGGIRIAA